MIFFKTGELLQNLAVARCADPSVRLASRPDTANWQTPRGLPVPPEQVQVGEIILVRPGEGAARRRSLAGQSSLDTSADRRAYSLSARMGDSLMAGMINLTASLKLRVTKPFNESSIAKILELVENASARKAATEKFITRFARWYTPIVVARCGRCSGASLVHGEADFETWIYRALVVLVVSCPCALVVSIPLGYFGGIGRPPARHTGRIELPGRASAVKLLCFDKTGTLTRGSFEVQQVVAKNGYEKDRLLEYAAIAEMQSNHPIAKPIVSKVGEMGLKLDSTAVSEHVDLPGRGVRPSSGARDTGRERRLLHHNRVAHDVCEFEGTAAHIVIDGVYAGHILIETR
jgi:Cd2+/Zn2+-exporting ATPase